jgi:hypothetical protein
MAGSPLSNPGTEQFAPPGANAEWPGNEDWMLVLEPDAPAGQRP